MINSSTTQTSLVNLIAKLLIPGLFCLHLALAFLITPGYMSIDEGTYHMMSENLAEYHDLEIRNGYDEFAADSLEIKTWTARTIKAIDGKLVPQYPYLYPVLTYPLYKLLGYRSLFVLNTLCFWLVLVVTWKLAKRLTGDVSIAWTAAVILGGCGYLFEYSLASMPHVTMVLLLTLSIYHMVVAFLDDRRANALACGLFWGLSLGIRYDSILIAPVLIIPFLFPWKVRVKRVVDVVLSSLPGLLLLVWTNYLKFGFLALLSYGSKTELDRYVAPGLIALVGGIVVWLITRRTPLLFIWHRRRYWWLALPLLAASLLVPKIREYVFQLAEGIYLMVINLTSDGLKKKEQMLNLATARGGITYIGGLKKALLQSCPYLACLLVPLIQIIRNPKERRHSMILMGPIALFIAFFGFFSWHGGLCLNMRYLLPVFPFAAILTAQLLVRYFGGLIACGSGLFCGVLMFTLVNGMKLDPHIIYLYLPLALSGLILIASLAVLYKPSISLLNSTFTALISTGLIWATLTTLFYDIPLTTGRRSLTWASGATVSRLVEPDSLLFVDTFDPYFLLIEKNVRLSRSLMNDFQDFRPLMEHHLNEDRKVYLALYPMNLSRLRSKQLLEGMSVTTLYRMGQITIAQITRNPVATDERESEPDAPEP